MVKAHNGDIDKKDSEIKKLKNEIVSEKNRTDEETVKMKASNVQELTGFRND